MLPNTLLSLFASSVLAHTVQVPLKSSHRWQDNLWRTFSDDEPTKWSLDDFPNPNDTDHLVFETVYSLLQHWPSVRMGNGHNIVPGVIPEGTLLYHGTTREEQPQGLEWVAFDPEHSYYYCREPVALRSQPGCWQLTLTTTRPLKVVYFDGMSGAKSPDGPLDTQDLLVFGESLPENVMEEARRSQSLCEWGKTFGVDGFVRTRMSFEVIICDFTSGVSVVSFSNIVSELGLPPDISANFVMFEVLNSAGWHNHFPGETRVQLDLAGLVSFYDTELVPSLVDVRAGQERWDHRARNVSKEDLSAVVSRLEAALARPSSSSSGIQWKTLIQGIIDRYAGRLELIQHLLDPSVTSPDEILQVASKVQTQLRIMLAPYLHLAAVPTASLDDALDWTVPIYRDCATVHTNFAASQLDSLTDSEKLLFRAARGTNREICRVVTKMWAAGVYAGVDPSLDTQDPVDITKVRRVWKVWGEDLNRLVTWLDWNVWVKCKPGCGPEEVCHIHEWPFHIPRFPGFTAKAEDRMAGSVPQPKCVSLVDP